MLSHTVCVCGKGDSKSELISKKSKENYWMKFKFTSKF